MSKTRPQNLKNHADSIPPFHFFLLIILLANLIIAIVYLVHHPHFYGGLAPGAVDRGHSVPLLQRSRIYPLKVQDRVIRLEERLRLQALAPAEWHAQIYRLSETS